MKTATLGNKLSASIKLKLQQWLDTLADPDLAYLDDDWHPVTADKMEFEVNIWLQDGQLMASAYRVIGRFTDITESFPLDVSAFKAANTQQHIPSKKASSRRKTSSLSL